MIRPRKTHNFEVSLHRQDGKLISRQPVNVDWEPALQWSLQRAIEEGKRPPVFAVGPAVIEPLWHESHKQPFISGFRVILGGGNGQKPYDCVFTGTYFYHHVLAARNVAIQAGMMTNDEQFIPGVLASAAGTSENAGRQDAEGDGAVSGHPRMRVRERKEEFPLSVRKLGPLLEGSLTIRADVSQEQDMPALIPSRVLEEAMARMLAAGDAETGGVLTGHLYRDPDSKRIFALVTAQIPALHTVEQLAQLTFTPETFFAAKAAVRERGREELILGWWHSHPMVKDPKAEDPNTREDVTETCEQPECHRSTVFFSEADCHVHRTLFSKAFGIALVLGARCSGEPDIGLFGWREGVIRERAFHLIERSGAPVTGSGGEREGEQNA